MKYNDDNMLMIDLEEVDEQAWDEAVDALMEDEDYLEEYQQMVECYEAPVIRFETGTPDDVCWMIDSINFSLNRCNHKLSEPIMMKVSHRVCLAERSDKVEEVVYHEHKLWAQEHLTDLDCPRRRCLEAYDADELGRLMKVIVDDLY